MNETKDLSETVDAEPPVEGSSSSSHGDPTKAGRYENIRLLGQGGFGQVYLARDKDLDRLVAIKVASEGHLP